MITLLLSAVTALMPIQQPQGLSADASSTVASYLLLTRTCDLLTGSKSFTSVKDQAYQILMSSGYSLEESASMIDGLVSANLGPYAAAVRKVAGSRKNIRYFCESEAQEKQSEIQMILDKETTSR